MTSIIYHVGLFVFSKAFAYALGAFALFAGAMEGRKRPDNMRLQPWQGVLAMACAFTLITVVEVCGQTTLVGRICLALLLGLAAYTLWRVCTWQKAQRAKMYGISPYRKGADLENQPR